MFWRVRSRTISLQKTLLMGILNLTPDSFSDGGKFLNPSDALNRATQLVADGADLLDLGAESTRPGAREISEDEELDRLLPSLKKICSSLDIPISVDTTKPAVARCALEAGAHIVNDVSGLSEGESIEMAKLARDFGAGLVLMHRRGNPLTMQGLANYHDVVSEVIAEMERSVKAARSAGVNPDQLVVDPGLGFSKTTQHNLEILKNLEKFQTLGLPVLLGPSRKNFIGEVTGRQVSDREFGTAAVVAMAVSKGVRVLRVHEVRSMRDAARMAEAIRGESDYVRT